MPDDKKKKSKLDGCFTSAEVQTASGQVINFSAHPEDIDRIRVAIGDVRSINLPVTGTVKNDVFRKNTRYNVFQHKYAGGGNSYIEVLEVTDPPDGRCGVVFYYYCYGESCFFEFDSVANAERAWEKYFSSCNYDNIRQQDGFRREVRCGIMTPWFYAVGNQMLEGDYVFLDIIQEDPEFRFGQRYIVMDPQSDIPRIKRCVGIRVYERETHHSGGKKEESRVVYWDDGTFWDSTGYHRPILLQEQELWIHEAMEKFRTLLAGEATEFAIEFLDGSKFIGTWKPKNAKANHAKGNYHARVILVGGNIREIEFYFSPTIEVPTVEEFIFANAKVSGVEIEKIETVVRVTKTGRGQKKWAGVYPPI